VPDRTPQAGADFLHASAIFGSVVGITLMVLSTNFMRANALAASVLSALMTSIDSRRHRLELVGHRLAPNLTASRSVSSALLAGRRA